jgi:choline dehydrogenase
VEAGGFLRLDPDAPTPEIQFHVAPALKNQPHRSIPVGHGFSINVCVLKPKSRGSIHLNSSSPQDKPRITPNFLSHPDDVKTLIAGIRKVRELVKTRAFSPYVKDELAPGYEVLSDAQLEQWARANLGTVFHPVGTCKMGHDDMAVVDDQLRVHGIEGLRVADASIMPTLIAGNTNAPAIMIGEKAADMILNHSGNYITQSIGQKLPIGA